MSKELSVLDQWEAEAKKTVDTWKNIITEIERPKSPFRILTLIDLVRKKDEAFRSIRRTKLTYIQDLPQTAGAEIAEKCTDALALTEELNG